MLADLIATEGVEEIHRPGGSAGVMAIHGGLEEGTAAIARAVADATGAALYAVIQPPDLRWHVPSIRYDPAESATLAAFLASIETTISLHGFGRPGLESTALLGGRNRSLAKGLAAEFTARGLRAIADLDAIPKRLKGVHRRNPVNLPPRRGVQVELPIELRSGRNLDVVSEALAAGLGRLELSARAVPG